jgi:hypothetical protein
MPPASTPGVIAGPKTRTPTPTAPAAQDCRRAIREYFDNYYRTCTGKPFDWNGKGHAHAVAAIATACDNNPAAAAALLDEALREEWFRNHFQPSTVSGQVSRLRKAIATRRPELLPPPGACPECAKRAGGVPKDRPHWPNCSLQSEHERAGFSSAEEHAAWDAYENTLPDPADVDAKVAAKRIFRGRWQRALDQGLDLAATAAEASRLRAWDLFGRAGLKKAPPPPAGDARPQWERAGCSSQDEYDAWFEHGQRLFKNMKTPRNDLEWGDLFEAFRESRRRGREGAA